MRRLLAICLLVCAFGSSSIAVPPHQTSDREKLIKTAHLLEQKPLDKSAKKLRSWAITYLATTKDVRFVICSGELTKPLLDKNTKYGAEVFAQYTIGMAAFKLGNPDKKEDEDAAQIAGFDSALKSYKALVKLDPKAKTPAMDDLITKRDKKQLPGLVAEVGCGKK